MSEVNHNPDVLTCLANLSNDEVFTPPEVASAVLDMLPSELWSNPNTKILDPATKSGIFLREAAKRLIDGLADKIPNLQERIDHIMHKQLYGYAITELTAHLSRRSLYCSKTANGPYSITQFKTDHGNVLYRRIEHKWENGKCAYCGASKETLDRGADMETHAYQFIHMSEKTQKELTDMKFDLIISNPPYQLSDGGAQASATPIYNLFVSQAKKLRPRYLSMIIPARWYGGGKGLETFREEMISDKRIRILHDYIDSRECFGNGVEVKGGICFFLWDRDNCGECIITTHDGSTSTVQPPRLLKEPGSEVFIRYAEGVSIYHKVKELKERSFSTLVSTQKPFGLRTFVHGEKTKFPGSVVLFEHGGTGYINETLVERNQEWVNQYKLFISRAYNAGDVYPHQIIGKPLMGVPGTCCTETYVVVGPFSTKNEAENVMTYIQTRFFRFLVSLIKVSQMASSFVYGFVPIQDFSKTWTDEELYAKYNITQDEIKFIESMIKPMDLTTTTNDGGSDE